MQCTDRPPKFETRPKLKVSKTIIFVDKYNESVIFPTQLNIFCYFEIVEIKQHQFKNLQNTFLSFEDLKTVYSISKSIGKV